MADGEHCLGYLRISKLRKEVGLVLDGVLGSCQKGSAVNIFSCCVMACGDAVVAFTPQDGNAGVRVERAGQGESPAAGKYR